MPSKKPIIHFNTEQWIIDKMMHIADDNSRSLAKEMEFLCKRHIEAYEAEHGEIQLPTPSDLKYGDIVTEEYIDMLYNAYDLYQPRLTRDMFINCLGKCIRKTSKGVFVNQEKLNRLVKNMCGY